MHSMFNVLNNLSYIYKNHVIEHGSCILKMLNMKTSVLFLGFGLLLCSSCKLISVINNESVTTKAGSIKVENVNLPIVRINIATAKEKAFLFDTGASLSFINSDSILDENTVRKAFTFGTIKTPDGGKTKNKLLPVHIETPWFESDNKVVGFFPISNGKCNYRMPFDGVVGLDVFINSDLILELNSQESVITSHKTENFDKNQLLGFEKIDAVFEKKSMKIPLTINGETNNYLLDTGNSSTIILPYSSHLDSLSNKKIIIEGKSLSSLKGKFGEEAIMFSNAKIGLGNQIFEAPVLTQKEGKIRNMGMEAIKQFNWFINFSTQEVYIKRNLLLPQEIVLKKMYYSSIEDDKIIVMTKVKGSNRYKLGDEIISVNNEKVTPENICEMQKILNQTEDWETLKIEVKSQMKI